MKATTRCVSGRSVNRLRFYTEIQKALQIFKEIDYSIITGGYAQNNSGKGDVDIITVLPCIYPYLNDELLLFANSHIEAQSRNGFSPDFQFPTDVITRQQIRDAVSGRALEIVDDKLQLKSYSNHEIVTNQESDYRVWLFEMITHDFDLVRGSFEMLSRDTLRAHKTIFLCLCEDHLHDGVFLLKWLRHQMFSIAGLKYVMGEKQSRYLLMMMEEEGFGRINSSGKIVLDVGRIQHESLALKNAIKKEMIHSAKHILPWDDLRKGVKRDGHN